MLASFSFAKKSHFALKSLGFLLDREQEHFRAPKPVTGRA
jgi:hypothetical protein